MDKKQEKTSPLQVDALLRLKRLEKPDAQFWERFDAELHQRMLQTLVQKEPWYRQLYYAFLRPKVQLYCAASLATVWVCVFGWPHAAPDTLDLYATKSETAESSASAVDAITAQIASMDLAPVMAAQLFDLESSFDLAGSFEDTQEFTLGTPSRQKSGLASLTF
jgi:hypothetical protein